MTADEIHIWFADLDFHLSAVEMFIETLDPEERAKAGRFHFAQDRKRYIARHGILRRILGSYLGVKAGELRFCQAKNGKPALGDPFGASTIRFNLSHANGAALFAFARNNEIGVDIEYIRAIDEMELIVERFFCEQEKNFFRALPLGKKREALFFYWTRKEAFIKALGEGLSRHLDTFDVSPSGPGDTSAIIDGVCGGAPGWSIHTLNLPREYAGALAVKNKSFTLRCFEWTPTAIPLSYRMPSTAPEEEAWILLLPAERHAA